MVLQLIWTSHVDLDVPCPIDVNDFSLDLLGLDVQSRTLR